MSTLKVMGKNIKYGLLKQTNWATPQDATADFKTQIWDKDNSVPDPDVFIDESNESGQYGIHEEAEMFNVDAVTGLSKLPFKSRVAKSLLIDYFAGSMFGVTEEELTPFAKTIVCAGLASPVDFKGDVAPLYSLAIDNTGVDDGQILENAILNSLNLVIDMNQRGIARHLQMTGDWVGNELNNEQTLAPGGGWVAKPTTGYFNDSDTFSASTFTINSVDYSAEVIKRFELDIQNNVVASELTSAGKPGQYIITPQYTVRVILDYNIVTEKIINQYGQGGIVVLTFLNNVTADTDGELGFVIPRAYMMSNPYVFDNGFLGIAIEARIKSVAGATPFTVNFTDAIDGAF